MTPPIIPPVIVLLAEDPDLDSVLTGVMSACVGVVVDMPSGHKSVHLSSVILYSEIYKIIDFQISKHLT